MRLFRNSLVVLTFVSLACNSKSQTQVYAEARPAADVLRAKTVAAAKIVDKLASPPSGATCKTTKKLTYDPSSDAHDTDYIMLEEAKRGGGKHEDGQPEDSPDLIFATSPFPQLLRGTHVPPFYETYMTSDPARGDFKDKIRRAKGVKNLVIVRSRSTAVEYFLVDLAAPTVLCSGSFDVTADASLGSRTDNYDVVTTNKRTGKEVGRVSHTDTHDDYKSALYMDATKKLAARMKTDLKINPPE
jgi:hypothetical protein